MLKDNIFYWQHSLSNPEPIFDSYYFVDEIIIKEDNIKIFKTLYDLISAFCTLRNNNIENGRKEIVNKINELLKNNFINYTEFVAFWKTLDFSLSIYQNIPISFNKNQILYELITKFCEKRYFLYKDFEFSPIVNQALYDFGSSRKQSELYKNKIKDIVSSTLRMKESDNFNEGDFFIFVNKNKWENIKNNFKLKYNFGAKNQNKIPDFVIRFGENIFIGEAKHIKELGGSQNKQIKELIDFIQQEEENNNIHYISFLDGLYFNLFEISQDNNKISKQKQDIENILEKYKNNYFVNTEGFRKLLEDLRDGNTGG